MAISLKGQQLSLYKIAERKRDDTNILKVVYQANQGLLDRDMYKAILKSGLYNQSLSNTPLLYSQSSSAVYLLFYIVSQLAMLSENWGFQARWVIMLLTQNTSITLSLHRSIWSLFTPSKFFYIFIAQYIIIPWFCRLAEMIKGDNSRTLKQNLLQTYPWISQPDGFFSTLHSEILN